MIGTVPWPLAAGLMVTTLGAAPLGYCGRVLIRRGTTLTARDVRGLRVAVLLMAALFVAGLSLRAPTLLL